MKTIRSVGIGTLLALQLVTIPAAVAAEDPPDAVDASAVLLPSPIAWVEGPRALDVNPAALGFRRALGGELGIASARPSGGPVGLGGYAGTFGLGVGGQAILAGEGSRGHAALGFGVPVTEALSLGAAFRLHVPGRELPVYGAWDLGVALRPASWLSLAGAVRDLAWVEGSEGRASPQLNAGVAIRPFGYRVSLGLDWIYETAGPPNPHHLRIAAMVEPVDGVQLLATVDDRANLGFGLQLHFRGGWVGGLARVHTRDDPGLGGWAAGVGTSADHRPTKLVPSRSLAEIDLGHLRENPTVSPLAPRMAATRFSDVLQTLRDLGDQRSVSALLLRLDGYSAGMAQTEELRAEILRLREGGTPVYAYLESGGDTVDYYLASACDRIWLHPAGTLAVTGLSSRMFFYKSAMDRFGVDAQFSRIGRYKSSPERFTETGPTGPNLEVRNALLDDRFERLLGALAEGRGVDAGEMGALVDDAPYPAALALERGLVDALVYPDEVRTRVKKDLARPKLNLREPLEEVAASPHWRAPNSIAVIHIDGLINTGRSGRLPLGLLEVAGSDTIARAIRHARGDRAIKAIVLRIDSPGGSAFASEEIWREVHRTRGKKPVVVSMASMAASGGYYSACAADRILADPSTLTGSIGVYAGKVSLGGLYQKLGVDTLRIQRGDNAGLYSYSEAWTPSEFRAVERIVDALYADFIEHVREGRGIEDIADVDRVAQGRVWTGAQALDAGLVDELGGLMDAVEVARELAGIPDRAEVHLRPMPRVGLIPSLQIGKGFVGTDLLGADLLPEELRWTLSGLLLMERQDNLATMTLAPIVVDD